MKSLAAKYERAVEIDQAQNGAESPTRYLIEKAWFDNFLAYKDSFESRATVITPGEINNGKLLQSSNTLSGVTLSSKSVTKKNDLDDNNLGDNERQLRKQRWQEVIERKQEEEKKGDEHFGGGKLQCRPELRENVDYVLVGMETWSFITSHFVYDVELPRQQRKTVCDGNVEMPNACSDTQQEQIGLEDAGSSVAVAPSASSLISETSSKSDLGDDLFPTLDRDPSPSVTFSSTAVVPYNPESSFNEAKSRLENMYGSRQPKSDNDTSDEDARLTPTPTEEQEFGHAATKRKRATGLGNLGNTCFMNSTLQCLAHTGPLREYFLNGQFKADLNKDNPLGTGGELASEFASLLRQMWGVKTEKDSLTPNGKIYTSSRVYSPGNYDSGLSSVTYPRSFKHTLGKFAAQFMGYDQHDSQELCAYLLDILHEDTNRVRKKPYVEKPEQEENESDDVAANKAWNLHLQREDSRVLENFMGQVKSRLECPVPGCGRISTTFDPSMYLSVPLPGSTDRVMKVTFVPLDLANKCAELTVKLCKNSTISGLRKHVSELAKECYKLKDDDLHSEDIGIADVFNSKVWNFFDKDDDAIDRITESDVVYAYQLEPQSEVKRAFETYRDKRAKISMSRKPQQSVSDTLDEMEKRKLDQDEQWQKVLENCQSKLNMLEFSRLVNPTRSKREEKLGFYTKLIKFIQSCKQCSECKKTDEPPVEDMQMERKPKGGSSDEDESRTLEEISEINTQFKTIRTLKELEILEYCAMKYMKNFISGTSAKKRPLGEEGVAIQYMIKKNSQKIGPLLARIPSNLIVSDLRELMGRRVIHATNSNSNSADMSLEDSSSSFASMSPLTALMRQAALTVEPRTTNQHCKGAAIGSVSLSPITNVNGCQILAKPTDEEEQELVVDKIDGMKAILVVNLPSKIQDDIIDINAIFSKEEYLTEKQLKEKMQPADTNVSLMDCITKYGEMEQLGENDMWYCNRCKEHVQAWKKIHLYRAPPILFIHLKRFHFSSTTHRRHKLDTQVDFPLNDLDLRELVTHWDEGKEPIYDLYAVSNHFGGVGGGHYTAYAKGDDGTWCNFDDSRVTSGIDESEVVSPAAYCLYYKRKDVSVNCDEAIEDMARGMALASEKDMSITERSDDMEIDNQSDSFLYRSDSASPSRHSMSDVDDLPPLLLDSNDDLPNNDDSLPRQ